MYAKNIKGWEVFLTSNQNSWATGYQWYKPCKSMTWGYSGPPVAIWGNCSGSTVHQTFKVSLVPRKGHPAAEQIEQPGAQSRDWTIRQANSSWMLYVFQLPLANHVWWHVYMRRYAQYEEFLSTKVQSWIRGATDPAQADRMRPPAPTVCPSRDM